VTDLAGNMVRVPGRRAGYRKGPTTEHRTPVSRYEHLLVAGGQQMLPTSNDCHDCTAVLWATDIDRPLHTACTALAEERPVSVAISNKLLSS